MTGTLFVVGTPIGNLGDLGPRARDTLASVDLVAAEDTRRTAMLMQQTVMYGWLMNRLAKGRARVTAEDAWEFCLRGLGG